MARFEKAAEALNKNPTEANWKAFARELKGSGLKYYKTVYANDKIKRLKDLKDSYAILYDGKYRVVTKVPVYRKLQSGEIGGALEYLAGLLNANKVD